MGILSTLITGGIMVGKVCQTIAGALGNAYMDKETGDVVAVGDTEICGVKFFQSGTSNGTMNSYAFNSNTQSNAVVVFPNDENGNGVAYEIPPTLKVTISPELNDSQSPDKEILCSTTTNTAQGAAAYLPMVKLSLNNLKIGGSPIKISDYQISAAKSGLQVISSRPIGAIKHLNMVSNSGISLNCQSDIDAETQNGTFGYAIDLGGAGLRDGDDLSGQLHIEMKADGGQVFSSAKAEPLTPAEERAFRKLGILKD